jgi:small subunit ribosomal protein S5
MNNRIEVNSSEHDFAKIGNQNNFDNKEKVVRISKAKYEEKIVQIKRVTKVVKGGKKMTFRAIVIVGNNLQKVGVGVGRAEDVNLAIEKAVSNGKRQLITVPVTYTNSIPHIIKASFGACQIMLRPASEGSGVIAGGSIKAVLELAGLKNVLAKQFGAKNILNNAKATLIALNQLNDKITIGNLKPIRIKNFYRKVIKLGV